MTARATLPPPSPLFYRRPAHQKRGYPVFAWIFASWALLVITPVYIYMVRGLEDARFVEDEIAEVAKLQAELQGASRIANTVAGADSADRRAVSTAATVGSSATNVSSSVVSGSKQHVV